jgi:4-amino-4-deoxy-L-arabinose transferase-like glycosyltransferase
MLTDIGRLQAVSGGLIGTGSLSGLRKRLSGWEVWRWPPPQWATSEIARAAKFWPLVVLLVGAALYLPYLDARPLRFEEGRRALQAIEMLDGNAWWHLRVLGEPYINKPPLTPWLISAVALLSGAVDEIAVRLPSIVFALVGGLAAGWAVAPLAPADHKVAALAAGLAFLCSIFLLLKTRVGETDVTVTALCGLSFAIWVRARWKGGVKPTHWLAIGSSFACAALCKGPIPVAFPAIPMVVMPLLERRHREAVLAFAVIAAAHAPLALWVWDNLTASNVQHWAVELRVAPNDRGSGIDWSRLFYLNDLPLTLLCLMPFLPAAAAMVFAHTELPRERRWPIAALLLYAVPMTLLTTIPPMGKARYAMPAAWPMAVLAGMWVAMKWRQLYLAPSVVNAGLVTAIVIQIVQIGFLEGRTPGQREFGARAEQLTAALAELPPGPLPVVWAGGDFNHNLLAYAGRRLYRLRAAEIGCRLGSDYLIAGRSVRNAVDASGDWTEFAALSDGSAIYRRVAGSPVADCVPAFRQ